MKILIMTVGGSPEPLVKSIKHFKPDFIYFIVSERSHSEVEDILKESNFSLNDCKRKKINNHNKVLDAYKVSIEIIKKSKDRADDIVVDFTGGTKTMAVGLFSAALNQNIAFNYTGDNGFEDSRDKNGLGSVKSSFEEFQEQCDPYKYFAIEEFNKGVDFFNNHQFSSARANFEIAYNKTEDIKLKNKFDYYVKLTYIYEKWDKFNNKSSSRLDNELAKIKKEMEKFSELTDIEFDFMQKLNENFEFLKSKLEGKVSDNLQYYFADLINNAQRRIDEGKYDDALARTYRAFELLAQLKINEHALWDKKEINNDKRFFYTKNNLKTQLGFEKYKKILKSFGVNGEKIENHNLPEDIRMWCEKNKKTGELKTSGLFQSFQLLSSLGEKIGSIFIEKYQVDKSPLNSHLSIRNSSILAHGLNPVSKNNAQKLLDMLIKFSIDNIDDFNENMIEQGEFPQLS